MKITLENGSVVDFPYSTNNVRGTRTKQLEDSQKVWQGLYDSLSKRQLFNLLMECIEMKEQSNKNNAKLTMIITMQKDALKEIESLTRNPREYGPSIYTLNHIARKGLKVKEDGLYEREEN